MISQRKESLDDTVSDKLIQLHFASRDAEVKQKSAGWVGSIAVHAVVLAIMCLLVAPADFGGVRPLLTIRQIESTSQSLDLVQISSDRWGNFSAESISFSQLKPIDTLLSASTPVSLNLGGDPSGQSVTVGGSPDGGTLSGGPRGSFFGIEASGQEFAYVLDMSGSMEGERYRRATSELLRSVSELRQDQSFYVLLFSDSTSLMFGEHPSNPRPVLATAENRERLRTWLRKTFEGGGTYPRNAIKLAMKMKPSAIFMLSDGEFYDDQTNQPQGLFQSKGDLFSMVRAFASPAPIHAIAFEDPKSCENMKRLAEITGGQYRYEESMAEAESLMAFEAAMKISDPSDVKLFEEAMTNIVARFPNTISANNARIELARILFDLAKSQQASGEMDTALATVVKMVSLLPTGQVLRPEQRLFIERLVPHVQANPNAQVEQATVATALDELRDAPDHKKRHSVDEFSAVLQTVSADRLFDQGKAAESMMALYEIANQFSNTGAGERARVRCDEFVAEWLEKSRGSLSAEEREATIEMLRAISTTFGRTTIGRAASDGLQQIAFQMLVKARDALDASEKAELESEITKLFYDDANFQNAKRQLLLTEARARRCLRVAQRLDRSQGIAAATSAYRRVVDQFPLTLSARQAGVRLDEADVDADNDPATLEAIAQEKLEADFQRLLNAQ